MVLWYYGSYTDEYGDCKFFKLPAERYDAWTVGRCLLNLVVFRADSHKKHGPEPLLQNYTRQFKNGIGVFGHTRINPDEKPWLFICMNDGDFILSRGVAPDNEEDIFTWRGFNGSAEAANKSFKRFINKVTTNEEKRRKEKEEGERERSEAQDRLRYSELLPGSVGFFNDGEGNHYALLMEVKSRAKMIFLTSKSYWNPKSRAATKEELLLFARRSDITNYLAPVVRDINNFKPVGYSFPDYRVEELKKEFWDT